MAKTSRRHLEPFGLIFRWVRPNLSNQFYFNWRREPYERLPNKCTTIEQMLGLSMSPVIVIAITLWGCWCVRMPVSSMRNPKYESVTSYPYRLAAIALNPSGPVFLLPTGQFTRGRHGARFVIEVVSFSGYPRQVNRSGVVEMVC